jgi:hypothetical protein
MSTNTRTITHNISLFCPCTRLSFHSSFLPIHLNWMNGPKFVSHSLSLSLLLLPSSTLLHLHFLLLLLQLSDRHPHIFFLQFILYVFLRLFSLSSLSSSSFYFIFVLSIFLLTFPFHHSSYTSHLLILLLLLSLLLHLSSTYTPSPSITPTPLQAYDTDSFNRWDAGNRLGSALILKLAAMPTVEDIEKTPLPTHFVDAIRAVLTSCKVRTSELWSIIRLDYPLVALSMTYDAIGYETRDVTFTILCDMM